MYIPRYDNNIILEFGWYDINDTVISETNLDIDKRIVSLLGDVRSNLPQYGGNETGGFLALTRFSSVWGRWDCPVILIIMIISSTKIILIMILELMLFSSAGGGLDCPGGHFEEKLIFNHYWSKAENDKIW